MQRRAFMVESGAAGLMAAASRKRIRGANDRLRIAVCGVRGRGLAHLHAYAAMPGVEIAALCDVDENVLRWRLRTLQRLGVPRPAVYTDVRRLLENASLDAVSVATPNHWHALIGIWTCQAGKDLYLEKPCCHSLWEGQQLLAAVRKYNRICQHGTQSRSHAAIQQAVGHLRAGTIGEMYMARALVFKWRPTIGHTPPQPVPPGVHYDLWTGPAPRHPFSLNRFHYNWHWFWDTGNGDIGNQGPHELDIARWGLGVTRPRRVSAMGGKFLFQDDQETPNLLSVLYEFESPNGQKKLLEVEVRGWISNHEAGIGTRAYRSRSLPVYAPAHAPARARTHFQAPDLARWRGDDFRLPLGPLPGTLDTVGNLFYGSKGYLAIAGFDTYRTFLGEHQHPGPSGRGGGNHFENFVQAVRARNPKLLNAPLDEGLLSVALIHLANASYRTGRALELRPDTYEVIGNDEAAALLRGGCRSPYTVPEQV